MKNVTLSADEHLIDRAREVASEKHTTLNQAFRDWLTSYTQDDSAIHDYRALMDQLRHIRAGRKYSREEMNER